MVSRMILVCLSIILGIGLSFVSSIPLDPNSTGTATKSNPIAPENKINAIPNPRVEALDLLLRITRQATNSNDSSGKNGCKYRKGSWSACDPKTKLKTRTFTLKKGDANVCQSTKTLQRECKGNRKGGRGKTGAKNRGGKNGNNSNRAKTITN